MEQKTKNTKKSPKRIIIQIVKTSKENGCKRLSVPQSATKPPNFQKFQKAGGHNPSSKASRSSSMLLWLLLWQLVFQVVSVAGAFPGWSLFYVCFQVARFPRFWFEHFWFWMWRALCGANFWKPKWMLFTHEAWPGGFHQMLISLVEGSPFDPVICLGQTGQKN